MKNIYEVLKKPLFTEKGASLKEGNNQLLFEVSTSANKQEIKQAVEDIFNVKVAKVATVAVRGKLKSQGRHSGRRPNWKKAIITLKKGEKLDLIEGV